MDEVLHKPAGRRPRQSDGRELSAQEQLGLLARRVVTDWKHFYQWARFHGRRVIHTVHDLAGGNRATGPVTFLAVSGALGLALTVSTLYAPAYTVTVDGDTLGVVSDQAVVADAVAQVERRGTEILGHDYQVEGQIGYDFTLSLRSELTQPDQVENYFLEQLSQVADGLRRYQVSVNGVAVGSVEEMGALESVLDQLKGQYVNENTISAEFVDDIQVEDVYSEEGQMTAEELQTALMANTTGDTTYTVVKGDTFNAIAYANDMYQRTVRAGSSLQRPEGAESGHRYQPTDDRGRAQCEGADPSAVGDHGGRRDLYRAHRMPGGGGEGLQHVCGGLEDPDPGYRGRGPGPRPGDLCERERDPAGDPVLHHPARAHHNSQGGGDQGEA